MPDYRETVEKLVDATAWFGGVALSGRGGRDMPHQQDRRVHLQALRDARILLTEQDAELKVYRDALDSEAILEQQRYKANYERVAKKVIEQDAELARRSLIHEETVERLKQSIRVLGEQVNKDGEELATLRAENARWRKARTTEIDCPCTDYHVAPYCPIHGG